MRKLVVIAALALFSTAADAKVHEIKIGGRIHRIEVPANCKKISCITVAKEKKSSARSKKEAKEVEPASPAPAAAAAATVAAPAAAAAVVAAPQSRPANPEPKPEFRIEAQNDDRKSLARLSLPTAGEEPKTVASSSNAVAAVEPKAEPVRTEAASPVGLWLTQKKEGKIRIEPCGAALCGHVDGKPSEKVLIDMKPGQNNRWNGKIHDVRSGGTYMAHISLKGDDSLVVRGCAFGGMFCGGETWTRAQ
jgi:uncharacterized protein (DUF2147 family)